MTRRFSPSIESAALLAAGCAAAALLAAGCATSNSSAGGYQAPIRMNAPELVAWEPDGPYDLDLVIVNGTSMQIQILAAKPEAAQVTLFRPDGTVACKTPNPARKTYEIWWIRKLGGGKSMPLRVDVRSACKTLEPGAYRYEAIYFSNPAHGASASLHQGFFGPETGRVLVREGATKLGIEELRTALTETAAPAAEVAQPGPASEPTATEPAAAADATPAKPETPAAEPDGDGREPATSPADIRACVDRELAGRGLNAYGDPKGTSYDSGAPVDEYGRILYVASRNPAIRRACGIPRF